ncbi:hypothetical protein [Pontibacillus marinus]|nr:hypothetical protein [Pontibacillus marinus]
MLFIIILAILSATILLSLLEKTIDEDHADDEEDIQNKVFRFAMNKRTSWKKAAFIWGMVGFLNTYTAIALAQPIPYGYFAVVGFGIAIAQVNNASEIYVRIMNSNLSIYRNAFLGSKKINLPSLLRVDLTKSQFRFYQENVLVGKVSLKYLRDGDEARLKSEIEEYIKVRTTHT